MDRCTWIVECLIWLRGKVSGSDAELVFKDTDGGIAADVDCISVFIDFSNKREAAEWGSSKLRSEEIICLIISVYKQYLPTELGSAFDLASFSSPK